jgi:hypothetical protein
MRSWARAGRPDQVGLDEAKPLHRAGEVGRRRQHGQACLGAKPVEGGPWCHAPCQRARACWVGKAGGEPGAMKPGRILFSIRSRLPATLRRMPSPPAPPDPADRTRGSADPLLPVGQAEVAAIAHGLRFDERGNFVILNRPPGTPHST